MLEICDNNKKNNTGFPLISSDKIPRLFQYFFHFPRLLLNTFYGFYSIFIAGPLESAYWLLGGGGGHTFLGNGAFGRFMISRPSLSCIHWLEFVDRMMWHHFGCTLWHHHFWNDVQNENDAASCCVWRNLYLFFLLMASTYYWITVLQVYIH